MRKLWEQDFARPGPHGVARISQRKGQGSGGGSSTAAARGKDSHRGQILVACVPSEGTSGIDLEQVPKAVGILKGNLARARNRKFIVLLDGAQQAKRQVTGSKGELKCSRMRIE